MHPRSRLRAFLAALPPCLLTLYLILTQTKSLFARLSRCPPSLSATHAPLLQLRCSAPLNNPIRLQLPLTQRTATQRRERRGTLGARHAAAAAPPPGRTPGGCPPGRRRRHAQGAFLWMSPAPYSRYSALDIHICNAADGVKRQKE